MRVLPWMLLLVACGGSPPPPATHEHFRAIQRHEATLDETRGAVLEGECTEACDASVAGCRAAERICDIADGVSDVDADLRCRVARERCAQYRASTERCSCP